MSRLLLVPSAALALLMALTPLVGVSAAESARAEGEVTWSVEPIAGTDGQRRTFEYSVDPGTQIVDRVVVTNSGETPAEFLIYATDAINEPATGAFGLLERDVEPTDVGSWIELASEKLTLQPGEQATIPFNLLVPSDATPGEHVAGIVASVVTIGVDDSGAEVALEQRVGARVYLTVSGPAIAGLDVAGVTSTFTPELNPFAPGTLDVSFEVRNTGNQRVDAVSTIAITGPFGIPLGEFTPTPVTELLPRQSVRVTAEVPAIAALALVFANVTVTPSPVGTVAAADAEDDAEAEAGDAAEPTASPEPTASAEATEATGSETTGSETTGSETAGADDEAQIVVADEEVAFDPVSQTAPALAISWTLLVIFLLVVAGVYLLWRYINGTRERLYLAIDQAAEAARQEADERRTGAAE